MESYSLEHKYADQRFFDEADLLGLQKGYLKLKTGVQACH